jgi:hypothetical protein
MTGSVAALPSAGSAGLDGEQMRFTIREEVREVEERRKRKQSVIIRGLDVRSNDELGNAFDPVARKLIGGPVLLSDIVCINRANKLYRAKICDDDVRTKLLDSAKSLMDTNLSHIYVSRDLTFAQRKSLLSRRAARRAGASESVANGLISPRTDLPESELSGN